MPFLKRDLLSVYRDSQGRFRAPMLHLRTVIIGPAAKYQESNAGNYDAQNLVFSYPERTDNEKIDLATIKVKVENGYAVYYTKLIGTDGTAQANVANKIRFANLVLRGGNGFNRSNQIPRDVQIDDEVVVFKTIGSTLVKHRSKIIGFEADIQSSSVGTATSDSYNAATQSAGSSFSQIAGTVNNVAISSVNVSGYQSLADGYINRVYFVTVTVGGAPASAKLKIESADGLDNVDNVTPAAFGSPTPLGTKGATVTFSTSGGDVFVVGQKWQITVNQAFTAPTPTSSGTYTGTTNKTYIITVSRGGLYTSSQPPLLTVTTSDGSEFSDNIAVTAAATPVSISNQGVQIAFSAGSGGLRKGDRYYISVTGPTPQQIRTILLQSELPTSLVGTDVNVDFGYLVTQEIPSSRTSPSNGLNWVANQTNVTIQSEVYLKDKDFNFPVRLKSGKIFVHYRFWKKFANLQPQLIQSQEQISALYGNIVIQNPLAYCANLALEHSPLNFRQQLSPAFVNLYSGIFVVPVSTDPDDITNWQNCIDELYDYPDFYNIVPLTERQDVITLFANFVSEQSTASVGRYKTLWITADPNTFAPIVNQSTTTNSNHALATVSDTETANFFNVVTVTSGNTQFLSGPVPVKPGDKLRINFTTNFDGSESYQEFTVKQVISDTRVTLVENVGSAITVPIRVEIWRDLKKGDLVQYLDNFYNYLRATTINTKRIRIAYPNVLVSGSDGSIYRLPNRTGAILATISSHSLIHQSLLNVVLNSNVSAANNRLSSAYYQALAEKGFIVVDLDEQDNGTYVRYSKSLFRGPEDFDSILFRNEVSVRNTDGLIKFIQFRVRELLGNLNFIEDLENVISGRISLAVEEIKTAMTHPSLGSPVDQVTVADLNLITTGPDAPRLEIRLNLTGRSIPINEIEFVV